MQVLKFIIVFNILLFLTDCKGQNKINNVEKLNFNEKTKMEEVLTAQLITGHSGLYNESFDVSLYKYSEKDLEAIIPILKNQLQSSGFKFLDTETFNKKVESIFGRIIDNKLPSKYLYMTTENKCDKNIFFYTNNHTIDINPYSYYIIKNDNFLTELNAIPELIDYKNEYPEIAKIEDSINKVFIDKEGEKINLYLWKEFEDYDAPEYNLKKQRYFNQQLLINRNKYLFNDNKASLAWLKFNDSLFLESLVKTFGYMNDKELLKWVIDKTLSDKNNKGEDFNSLFFMKDCSNKFVFHKETFEALKENINNKTLAALENYVYYREENKELQTLPFEQKAQVLAYVLYTGEYFAQQEKYSNRFMFKFMGTFYEFDKEGDKYDEEFKKNNYYNLPDFKKLWEQAKEEGDGIGLPM